MVRHEGSIFHMLESAIKVQTPVGELRTDWHYSEGAFIMSQNIHFLVFFINRNICCPKGYRLPGSTSAGMLRKSLPRLWVPSSDASVVILQTSQLALLRSKIN